MATTDSSRLFANDLQASAPEVRIGLSRAGVTGVHKAIRLRRGPHEKLVSAQIDCFVDLEPAQKGVHMSRFPELFGAAIDDVVIREAFLVEELAEHIAGHVLGRQRALRAEVKIVASYPMARETPVSGLPTQEMVSLIGIATASAQGTRRVVGVEASGINACPCAQGMVRERAAERLAEAGFDEADVEQILGLVPLATHNQRGRGTLYVGTAQSGVNAERLVEIVEDSVRLALRGVLDAYPELAEGDFLYSRQVNFETIHSHDVLAERHGTVAELRAELDRGTRLERHTELSAWLAA